MNEMIESIIGLIEQSGLGGALVIIAVLTTYMTIWLLKKLMKACEEDRDREKSEKEDYKKKYEDLQKEHTRAIERTYERERDMSVLLKMQSNGNS